MTTASTVPTFSMGSTNAGAFGAASNGIMQFGTGSGFGAPTFGTGNASSSTGMSSFGAAANAMPFGFAAPVQQATSIFPSDPQQQNASSAYAFGSSGTISTVKRTSDHSAEDVTTKRRFFGNGGNSVFGQSQPQQQQPGQSFNFGQQAAATFGSAGPSQIPNSFNFASTPSFNFQASSGGTPAPSDVFQFGAGQPGGGVAGTGATSTGRLFKKAVSRTGAKK